MKAFIGLVVGLIALGVVLAAAAIAFGTASTVVTTVHPIEDFGVVQSSVQPSTDRLAIQIDLTLAKPEITTVVLQRSDDPDNDDWQDVVTIPPDSSHHVSENTIEYLDEDVEHGVTYTYRVLLSDSDGGSGQNYLDTVTANDPSR